MGMINLTLDKVQKCTLGLTSKKMTKIVCFFFVCLILVKISFNFIHIQNTRRNIFHILGNYLRTVI